MSLSATGKNRRTATTLTMNAGKNSVVTIVGLPGGQTQSLPKSYVQRFPRWIVNDNGQLVKQQQQQEKDEGESSSSSSLKFKSSTSSSLSWESGLEMRPTVEFLIQNGIPKYVMAGLQLRKNNNNNNESSSSNVEPMKCLTPSSSPPSDVAVVVVARQWTTFSFAVEPNFRIQVFEKQKQTIHQSNNNNNNNGDEDDTQENQEDSILEVNFLSSEKDDDDNNDSTAAAQQRQQSQLFQQALELFGIVTSQIDESDEENNSNGELLQGGFHIVSIPLQLDWKAIPNRRNKTTAINDSRSSCTATTSSTTIVVLATAEPDAEVLVNMDSTLLEMTASSILELDIVGE